MPTKAELLQLQKLYKTDEKIGERLGGVPAYLVAYWRRKKNIPKYSLPKFSESEVLTLWERYGDDEKCGLELGISKAAFYNWRRRYGIKEKPAFLKLEQLEFNFPGSRISMHSAPLYGKQTIVQKIFARASEQEKVEVGQEVELEPGMTLIDGDIMAAVETFREAGVEYVWNPSRIILSPGQYRKPQGKLVTADGRALREFAKRQGIRALYDLREGSVSQVAMEKGHLLPGFLSLGTDRHVTSYGAVGALGMALDETSLGAAWAKGRASLTVPDTIHVAVTGRRARGVYAKDIALHLARKLREGAAAGRSIEFAGSVVSQMSISERFTISDMVTGFGAIGALCPYDATIRRYLTGRTMINYKPLLPDKDAEYEQMFQVSVDQVPPQIATGKNLSDIKAVQECEQIPVTRIVVGFCTNGRFDDLRIAADVLKGNRVHADCQLFILPASRTVYLEALKKGLIRIFVEAGAIVLPAGSGPFVESMMADLPDGEKILSTGAWANAPSRKLESGDVYLCSPATAVASSLSATITEPSRFVK